MLGNSKIFKVLLSLLSVLIGIVGIAFLGLLIYQVSREAPIITTAAGILVVGFLLHKHKAGDLRLWFFEQAAIARGISSSDIRTKKEFLTGLWQRYQEVTLFGAFLVVFDVVLFCVIIWIGLSGLPTS